MVASGALPTPSANDELSAADDAPAAQPVEAVLCLSFDSREAAREYASSLASLLHGSSDNCAVVAPTGSIRDDLDFAEITQRVANGLPPSSLRFNVRGDQTAQNVLIAGTGTEVNVTTRLAPGAAPTGVLWLQANHEHPGLCPVLALPVWRDGFAGDTVRALVGLAARSKGLREASLRIGGEAAPRLALEVDRTAEGQYAGSDRQPLAASSRARTFGVAITHRGNHPCRAQPAVDHRPSRMVGTVRRSRQGCSAARC